MADGQIDTLLIAPGAGHDPQVHTLEPDFMPIDSFFAYPAFTGGVFVGGTG
jgi:hypothetical protein